MMFKVMEQLSPKPSDSAAESLLQATKAESPAAAQSAADSFKRKNAWASLSEKSKYALRDSVYQQGKALGYDKLACRASLERLLPVDPAVGHKRAQQKQTLQALAKNLSELEAGKEALRQASDSLFARLEDKQATFSQHVEQAQAAIAAARSDLAADRALLRKEQLMLQATAASRQAIEDKLRACSPADGSTIAVRVGQTTFELFARDVREKGGLLKSIFFDGFDDPRDDQGIFHLRVPHMCANDFQLVGMYYADELPAYVSPQTKDRLLPMLDYLGLDAMVTEITKRGAPPILPPVRWEYQAVRVGKLTSPRPRSMPYQESVWLYSPEPGWEVFHTENFHWNDNCYQQILLLRRPC